MSVTNIINNEELTLVQGVGGLFLCEESCVMQNQKNAHYIVISDKKMTTKKNESNSTKYSLTKL